MGLEKGEAFVLRARPFAESDLIVTLFTERWGKRALIAKRARRFDSALGGAFDLLNKVEVVFYPRARLDLASQATLLHGYPELKRDLGGTSVALGVARALDRLAPPHQEEKEAYALFDRLLVLLEEGVAPVGRTGLAATLKVLALSGHRPQLATCVACGRSRGPFSFSCERGGLLCEGCGRGDDVAVSRGLALSLDSLLRLPLERSRVVVLSEEDEALAGEVLSRYIAHCASGS